jgi:acyl phosphate:glycerol-3-phosphate acyltransferase
MTNFQIASCSLSYLLGSVPFGLIIGKLRGVDIRTQGSGNIGATNVFRCVGKPWGTAAFILDFLKGYGATALIPLLVETLTQEAFSVNLRLVCGILAILGHNYPIFLKFKGGKGIATSAGVLAGIAPLVILPAIGAWLLLFLTTRYVSLGSIGAALMAAAGGWIFYPGQGAIPWALTLLGLLAIWRHRSNIQRLLKGEENRFDFSKRRKKSPQEDPDE